MSTRNKALAAALLLIGLTLVAQASTVTPQIGGGISQFDGGIGWSGTVAAQPTGKLLMVDAASHVLQTDGTSKVCLAGGC
jgi:hypothetical protein